MNFIKEKREKVGLKQGDFVKEANLQISRSTYARYERENFKDLRLSDLQNIVSYFYPNLALSVLDIIEFYATNEEELLKPREKVVEEIVNNNNEYYENRIAELEKELQRYQDGYNDCRLDIQYCEEEIKKLDNELRKYKEALKNVANCL